MTTSEILREMVALMDKGHCRGHLAVNKLGLAIGPTHDEAVAYCAIGAACKVRSIHGTMPTSISELYENRFGRSVSEDNDYLPYVIFRKKLLILAGELE